MTVLAFPVVRSAFSALRETYVSSDQILKLSANMGIALLMPSTVYAGRNGIGSLESVRLEDGFSPQREHSVQLDPQRWQCCHSQP